MNISANAAAPIGHNQPPSDIENIMQGVKERAEPVLNGLRILMNRAQDEYSGITIDSQEKCSEISDFIKKTKESARKVEALRVAEKEPFKAAGDAVHAYFKTILDSVDNMTRKLTLVTTDYLNEQLRQKRLRDAAAAEEARKLAAAQVDNAVKLDDAGLKDQANNSLSKAQTTVATAQKLEMTSTAKASDLVRTRGEASLATLRTTWKGEVLDVDALDLNLLRAFMTRDDLQKALNAYVRAGNRGPVAGARIYEDSTASIR